MAFTVLYLRSDLLSGYYERAVWLCQQKSTSLLKAEHVIVASSWHLVSRVSLFFILETKFVFEKMTDTYEKANADKERDLSSKMI